MRLRALACAALMAVSILGFPTSWSSRPARGAGMSSDNVTYLGTIPLEAGTWSTARLHEGYVYASGNKSFTIYDVSDPANPQIVSHTPTGVQLLNEDIDTNGEILLITDERGRGILHIWSVEDKANPTKLAELEGMVDHNFACVFECKWAYGAGGDIVDLRDPANPKAVGRWYDEAPMPLWSLDTFEVSPGVVLTGSQTMHLLDGRKNPAKPKVLAQAGAPDERRIHSVKWPHSGKDRFLLAQSETSPKPQCDERSGAFLTWDTRNWRTKRSFKLIDEYRVDAGAFADGKPPVSKLGCSATWFQHHPKFNNGGLVAAAFFDHGTRFLKVAKDGQISEVGYYMPYGGSTTSSIWITDEIVYAIDIVHGIDILRYNKS